MQCEFRLEVCIANFTVSLHTQVMNEILEYHREYPTQLFEEIRLIPLPALDDFPIDE